MSKEKKKDKNYNIIFDDKIVNNKGQSVNAQIKTLDNGEIEIKINPNSPKPGEFLIIHEVTHAIETNEMKKLILDYASQHDDFKQALNNLKATYGTDEVSSEVIADISGQLFGNQEFINNLSLEKPNIFKRIYNSIISLVNKITGNSNEALFIKDLKNKWETAYRNTNQEQAMNNLNNNASFSIQQDSNGNNYVNVDVDQELFDNLSLKEQRKMAKMVIMEYFSNDGVNVNGQKININSKTSSEYTNPNNNLKIKTKESKYRLSTELDNLLKVSKKINKNPIPDNIEHKSHSFAKDGWDYYYSKFQVGNQEYIGKLNIGINGNQKTLYDVTDIKTVQEYKKMTDNDKLDKTSTALIRSFIDNNITQSKENVKLPTKYSMQDNVNDTQNEVANNLNNESFLIENNSNLRYNSIEEAIENDSRKAPYRKYSNCVEFFNLDYNTMKKAIAIGSKYALNAQNMGNDSYFFNDDNYVYYFNILDTKNNAFGITNVQPIKTVSKEAWNEGNISENSKYIDNISKYEQRSRDSNNQSIRYKETSNRNAQLLREEQGQSRVNENRQITEKIIRDKQRELDNSSFSVEYNNQEKIYNGTILIRNDANGNKYLYDILNIKELKKLANLPSVASNSNKSSAIIDGSYIAYAKRNLSANNKLTNKIKKRNAYE